MNKTFKAPNRDMWRKIRIFRQYLNELDQLELESWEQYEATKKIKDGVYAYDMQTRLFEAKKIYTMLYGNTTMDYQEVVRSRDQINETRTQQGLTPISEDRRF